MHTGGDFWHYGGLTRSVEVHALPHEKPAVWRAYATPVGAALDAPWVAPTAVDLEVVLTTNVTGSLDLDVAFDGGAAATSSVSFTSGRATLRNVAVPDPTLWSLAEPNLHVVSVTASGGGPGRNRSATLPCAATPRSGRVGAAGRAP